MLLLLTSGCKDTEALGFQQIFLICFKENFSPERKSVVFAA